MMVVPRSIRLHGTTGDPYYQFGYRRVDERGATQQSYSTVRERYDKNMREVEDGVSPMRSVQPIRSSTYQQRRAAPTKIDDEPHCCHWKEQDVRREKSAQ